MEPEDLTLWQERHLVSRWGIRILRECIEKGVSNTVYFAEYKRFLELKGGGYTPEQFVKYFGAMYGSLPFRRMAYGKGLERVGAAWRIRGGSAR